MHAEKIVVGRAIRRDGDPVSDFWRLLPHQYPSFWAWDEGLALIPNPNPLFPRPAKIVQVTYVELPRAGMASHGLGVQNAPHLHRWGTKICHE